MADVTTMTREQLSAKAREIVDNILATMPQNPDLPMRSVDEVVGLFKLADDLGVAAELKVGKELAQVRKAAKSNNIPFGPGDKYETLVKGQINTFIGGMAKAVELASKKLIDEHPDYKGQQAADKMTEYVADYLRRDPHSREAIGFINDLSAIADPNVETTSSGNRDQVIEQRIEKLVYGGNEPFSISKFLAQHAPQGQAPQQTAEVTKEKSAPKAESSNKKPVEKEKSSTSEKPTTPPTQAKPKPESNTDTQPEASPPAPAKPSKPKLTNFDNDDAAAIAARVDLSQAPAIANRIQDGILGIKGSPSFRNEQVPKHGKKGGDPFSWITQFWMDNVQPGMNWLRDMAMGLLHAVSLLFGGEGFGKAFASIGEYRAQASTGRQMKSVLANIYGSDPVDIEFTSKTGATPDVYVQISTYRGDLLQARREFDSFLRSNGRPTGADYDAARQRLDMAERRMEVLDDRLQADYGKSAKELFDEFKDYKQSVMYAVAESMGEQARANGLKDTPGAEQLMAGFRTNAPVPELTRNRKQGREHPSHAPSRPSINPNDYNVGYDAKPVPSDVPPLVTPGSVPSLTDRSGEIRLPG